LKLMHYTAHHKFTRLQFAVSFFSQWTYFYSSNC
jgi:hypothetical protein